MGVKGPAPLPPGPLIGKLLLLGQYSRALDAIMLGTGIDKTPTGVMKTPLTYARQLYVDGSALGAVMSAMPRAMVKERMCLKAMLRFGWTRRTPAKGGGGLSGDRGCGDHNGGVPVPVPAEDEALSARVLGQVPFSTRALWVSAYQSWLWNKVASHRLLLLMSEAAPHSHPPLSESQPHLLSVGASAGASTLLDTYQQNSSYDKRNDSRRSQSQLMLMAVEGDLVYSSSLQPPPPITGMSQASGTGLGAVAPVLDCQGGI